MSKVFRKRAYARALGVSVKYTGKEFNDTGYGYSGLCKTWLIYKGDFDTLGYGNWASPTDKIDNIIFKERIDIAARGRLL